MPRRSRHTRHADMYAALCCQSACMTHSCRRAASMTVEDLGKHTDLQKFAVAPASLLSLRQLTLKSLSLKAPALSGPPTMTATSTTASATFVRCRMILKYQPMEHGTCYALHSLIAKPTVPIGQRSTHLAAHRVPSGRRSADLIARFCICYAVSSQYKAKSRVLEFVTPARPHAHSRAGSWIGETLRVHPGLPLRCTPHSATPHPSCHYH